MASTSRPRLDPPPARPPHLAAGAVALAPLLLWTLLTWKHRAHELEDGFIYLRYVANALAGHGLVFNPGEYVNGLTSPLFGYLVLAFGTVLGDARVAASVVSALATLAAAALLVVLFRRARPESPAFHAPSAALLLVAAPLTYMTYGMEAALYAALCAAALWAWAARRPRATPCLLAFALLARPEAVFLVATLFALDLLESRGRPCWPTLALPCLAFAMQAAANLAYYGTVLSSSGVAKIGQGSSGLWWNANFVLDLVTHVDRYFAGSWLLAGSFGVLAAVGILACRDTRLRNGLLLFLAATTAFYTTFGVPAQPWYYAPFYFAAWLFAACGWSFLAVAFEERSWLRHRPNAARAVAASVLVGLATASALAAWRSGIAPNVVAYRAIGRWIATNTPADAGVAACEIGTVGWYSERRIIDVLGLVRPANARSIAAGDVHAWLPRDRPDYILVHDPAWHLEEAAIRAERAGRYRPVDGFRFPGYRLLERRPVQS
jgi:arabinofuranosyltransferase